MRSTFRVLDRNIPKLEQVLRLDENGLLILSSQNIEGQIVHTPLIFTLVTKSHWNTEEAQRFRDRRRHSA
jgi:hypothetical protein